MTAGWPAVKNRRQDRNTAGQVFWATIATIAFTDAFSPSVGDALSTYNWIHICIPIAKKGKEKMQSKPPIEGFRLEGDDAGAAYEYSW